MVCPRCIDAVCELLAKNSIIYYSVELGGANIKEVLAPRKKKKLARGLKKIGFELIEGKETELTNTVKSFIIDKIHHNKSDESKQNLSDDLSSKLNKDYSSISRIFSKTEGKTIEQFIKLQRIERVKELMSYNQMNLSEIAYDVGYSSVSHLSNQFKDVTGMSPSEFKKQNTFDRNFLDDV